MHVAGVTSSSHVGNGGTKRKGAEGPSPKDVFKIPCIVYMKIIRRGTI